MTHVDSDQANITRGAHKYVVVNDGQFMWPAYRDAPMGAVPSELMTRIGYGVGSRDCIDLCNLLVDAGAEKLHV